LPRIIEREKITDPGQANIIGTDTAPIVIKPLTQKVGEFDMSARNFGGRDLAPIINENRWLIGKAEDLIAPIGPLGNAKGFGRRMLRGATIIGELEQLVDR
jgi:hypothetical protein